MFQFWARRNSGPRISFRLFREILLRLDKLSSNSSFSAALSKPSKGILIGSGVRQPAVQP
jgi:hypothetical protein